MPKVARHWLYDHRIVALSKASNHQADIDVRMKARMEGRGETFVAPVRPICIGEALLGLAEQSYTHTEKDMFQRTLMPHQVAVAVAGGMNMWATVVEALMQKDKHNCMCAIDLTNMFNDIDRDELIDECLNFPSGELTPKPSR